MSDVPGPGAYSLKPSQDNIAFSLGVRRSERKRSLSPGPGQYSYSIDPILEKTPHYRMGTSKRSNLARVSVTPGPGTYSRIKKLSEGPKWGLGVGERTNLVKNTGPGPGTYAVPNITDTRAYSLAGRHSFSPVDSNPGPGAYNAK